MNKWLFSLQLLRLFSVGIEFSSSLHEPAFLYFFLNHPILVWKIFFWKMIGKYLLTKLSYLLHKTKCAIFQFISFVIIKLYFIYCCFIFVLFHICVVSFWPKIKIEIEKHNDL